MSHIREPCVHLVDCSWDCGPEEELIQDLYLREIAQLRPSELGPEKTIHSITIQMVNGSQLVLDFSKKRDPDLLVFSERVFYELVFDGVMRRQGSWVANEVARRLREKPPLPTSGATTAV